jgi:hypothetical protein
MTINLTSQRTLILVLTQLNPIHLVLLVSWVGVRLSPLGTLVTKCPVIQPRIVDDDECGAVGGVIIARRNGSTHRKPAPVPRCPPQIPHDLTWAQTRTTLVETGD